MQEHTRAAPRLIAVAAIALVAAAFAAFTLLSGSDVAGAAGTGGPSSSGARFQPVQSGEGQDAPPAGRDRDRDGHPCPDEQGGGGSGQDDGGSSESAPSGSATPGTEL